MAHVKRTVGLEAELKVMSKPQRRVKRLDWTALQHKIAGEKYIASRSTITKTKTKGTMLTLRRIAYKLGNDYRAAVNWAYASIEANEFELCVP